MAEKLTPVICSFMETEYILLLLDFRVLQSRVQTHQFSNFIIQKMKIIHVNVNIKMVFVVQLIIIEMLEEILFL